MASTFFAVNPSKGLLAVPPVKREATFVVKAPPISFNLAPVSKTMFSIAEASFSVLLPSSRVLPSSTVTVANVSIAPKTKLPVTLNVSVALLPCSVVPESPRLFKAPESSVAPVSRFLKSS